MRRQNLLAEGPGKYAHERQFLAADPFCVIAHKQKSYRPFGGICRPPTRRSDTHEEFMLEVCGCRPSEDIGILPSSGSIVHQHKPNAQQHAADDVGQPMRAGDQPPGDHKSSERTEGHKHGAADSRTADAAV